MLINKKTNYNTNYEWIYLLQYNSNKIPKQETREKDLLTISFTSTKTFIIIMAAIFDFISFVIRIKRKKKLPGTVKYHMSFNDRAKDKMPETEKLITFLFHFVTPYPGISSTNF